MVYLSAIRTSSAIYWRSGRRVKKPSATSAIIFGSEAILPLTINSPVGSKCAATAKASRLVHPAAYWEARFDNLDICITQS